MFGNQKIAIIFSSASIREGSALKSLSSVLLIFFTITFISCNNAADPTDYSGNGILSEAPVCLNTGLATEGWYYDDPAGATPILIIGCNGDTATCLYDKTRNEGWYEVSNDSLIEYADCRQ